MYRYRRVEYTYVLMGIGDMGMGARWISILFRSLNFSTVKQHVIKQRQLHKYNIIKWWAHTFTW